MKNLLYASELGTSEHVTYFGISICEIFINLSNFSYAYTDNLLQLE